jgi:hypothetical protein
MPTPLCDVAHEAVWALLESILREWRTKHVSKERLATFSLLRSVGACRVKPSSEAQGGLS